MLSRRSFIVAGACAVTTSTAQASMALPAKLFSTDIKVEGEAAAIHPVSYQYISQLKSSRFYLSNQQTIARAELVAVHDLNTDERLEQFVLVFKVAPEQVEQLVGLCRGDHAYERGLRDMPMMIEKNGDFAQTGYIRSTFSRITSGV